MADRSPLRLTASELERLPYEERLEACWSFIDRVTARLESATRHSVEASDEEREARESLPGEGKESNHSCGGLGGGGPQEASRSSLGGKASGGIWGLCC